MAEPIPNDIWHCTIKNIRLGLFFRLSSASSRSISISTIIVGSLSIGEIWGDSFLNVQYHMFLRCGYEITIFCTVL